MAYNERERRWAGKEEARAEDKTGEWFHFNLFSRNYSPPIVTSRSIAGAADGGRRAREETGGGGGGHS